MNMVYETSEIARTYGEGLLSMVKCWNPIANLRQQNRNVALNILVAIIGGISSGIYEV